MADYLHHEARQVDRRHRLARDGWWLAEQGSRLVGDRLSTAEAVRLNRGQR